MPRPRQHAIREKPRHVPPWRGPMLLALAIILVGVFLLQQSPKTSNSSKSRVPSTSSTTTTSAPAARLHSLQISSGPTWVPLGSAQLLTLGTSSLKSESGVAVSLEVFPKIESRSQFQYISKNGVSSLPIASSPPVDLNKLPKASAGSPQLAFEISQSALPNTNPRSASSLSYIQIPYCSPNCAGVYPLLAVFVKSSQVVGTALTKMVLEPSASVAHPINFALVVRAPFTGNTANDLNSFVLLVNAVRSQPLSHLTIDIPGVVLEEAMGSQAPTVKTALAYLLSWSQQPNHEISVPSFAPVNLTQLDASGMSYVGPLELAAGTKQLDQFLHQASGSAGPVAITGGLTSRSAATLASSGIHQIFLGAKYFLPFNQKYSLSQPFQLQTNDRTTLTVLAQDAGLESDMASKPLPYDSANQLASDLAQIYFDQPNDVAPRIVSAVFQVSSAPDATNLASMLSVLSGSPLVKTVDAKGAFSLVPSYNLRSGKIVNPGQYRPLDAQSFRKVANQISALKSSIGQNALVTQANGQLLASASDTLSRQQSQAFLSNSAKIVTNIAHMISLASNKSFTVTARRVQLPIAISSQLKVPFKAVLVISSDRLSFPHGNTLPVLLNGPNTTLSIPIYAETLGSYLISAKLFTPNGQFVVAHTSIEVRSTAFSAVSIVLTLGAFLILALWWIRSFRRGYRRNKRLVAEKKQTS